MMNKRKSNGPFSKLIEGFISFKRSLGYIYGTSIVCRLHEMDRFFMEMGVTEVCITKKMYYAWTEMRPGQKATTMGRRRTVIRTFAKHLKSLGYEAYTGHDDERTVHQDFVPYIFSADEIGRMVAILAERMKQPSYGVNEASFYLAFLLYYCCGFRLQEVLKLSISDVDCERGRITVFDGKNGVSRIVMVSVSLLKELHRYVRLYRFHAEPHAPFLCNSSGDRFSRNSLYEKYHELLQEAGIGRRPDGKLPRIHDLRHTFAVNALRNMEAKGFDLYVSLSLLSRYLGHKSIVETEYYLRLTDEHQDDVLEKCAHAYPDLFPAVGGGNE